MKGICLRYAHHVDDAEDILQESFIRVFKKLDTYKDNGKLPQWIKTIVIHSAIEYYRKRQTRQKYYDDYGNHVETKELESQLDKLSLDEILLKVQRLAEGYRMVFNLYMIEGYNHREIGELLGISENTSKSQLSRARKLMQEMILADQKMELRHAK